VTTLRRRATLDVLTLNRGDHAGYAAIRAAIDGMAFVALQEMYSVQSILDQLEADGLGVWRGNLPGSVASPVVWDPDQVTVTEKHCYPLLPEATIAGTHNMAKTLNLVVGHHLASHRRVAFGSAHNIHRQYLPGRGEPARRHNERLVHAADNFGCARIVGMDSNAKQNGKSLAPIRAAAGWHYDQTRASIVTHGRHWSPDGFAYADSDEHLGLLTFVDHWAVPVDGTDHRGNHARFTLLLRGEV
jgi:hypothetical protein